METAKNFVGSSLVDARVREEIDVPDPATGELLGSVPSPGAGTKAVVKVDEEGTA